MTDRTEDLPLEELLTALRSEGSAPRGPECPDQGVWFEVAGGVPAPQTQGALLAHAAECDYCGARLREALRDLGDDEPAEKVVRMPASRRLVRHWWTWAAAAVVVAGVCTGSWVFAKPAYFAWRARALLAESQKEARYTTFRLADAPYARTAINRGAANEPDRLVEAEELARHAGPGAQADLLRARIALASGDQEDVSRQVAAAIAAQGETAQLANDLGVAYAVAGALPEALEAFGRSLSRNPSFAPALYNRALILSLLGRNREACSTTAAFMAAETDPAWRRDLTSTVPCPR